MEERAVIIPYKPRDAFLTYHQADKRYSLTVAHRRAGKTVARINRLIRSAAICERDAPRFAYLAPYYVQAKDIAWNYLKHYSAPILELGGKINESELSVVFPHNGAQIRLYGADNAERLRGLYFDGLSADEAQDIKPSVLTQIILPALSDRHGWLDLSGTPKGWGNLLGETYKKRKDDPEWFVQILRSSETGLIDPDDIQVRELGSGKSRLEVAAGLGIKFDVVPNIPIKDGIDAARLTIPRCYFDERKCATGLDALKQYREKIDEKRAISFGPLHDWTSHAADAFRYLAVALQETQPERKRTIQAVSWLG